MTVDAFLARYFRASERRASPRSVSAETRVDCGATLEQAQHAEMAYTVSIVIMGAAERSGLTGTMLRVLERYYLSLSNTHVGLVLRKPVGRAPERATVRYVGDGETPDDAADLQSYVSWPKLARACGVGGRTPAASARALWSQGRDVVRRELDRRGMLGEQDDNA